jgi:FAD/FMN-containing dehydrogenase
MMPYLLDWRGRTPGHAPVLLTPTTTAQVAGVVRICGDHGLALTIQGGNTGLVGGQIPMGEVLLSMKKLNRIRSTARGVMVAEAGVALGAVHAAVAETGQRFTLDLASRDSATIGGLCATNAGGVEVLRFGMMRAQVLGVEAVLPNGDVLNTLSPLYKNNTGPDLAQLLIGSEGTLGVITAASLRLRPQPQSTATAMVAVASVTAALDLLHHADTALGAGLEAFELISATALDMVTRHIPGARSPFAVVHPWVVLMQVTAPDAHAVPKAEAALGASPVVDAVVAQSGAQVAALWALRENISAAQKPEGPSLKHDISLAVARVPDFLDVMLPRLQILCPGCRPVVFGHLGDGNLHFNISAPLGGDFGVAADDVSDAVYTQVVAMGGSISAEHGIGVAKRDLAMRLIPAEQRHAQHAIRTALDPRGLFNPRVLF